MPLGKRDFCAARSSQSNRRTSNASLRKTVTSSVKALQNCYNFTSLSAHSQHEIRPKSCSQWICRWCIVFHCSLRINSMGMLLWCKEKKIHSPSFQVNALESIFHSLKEPAQILLLSMPQRSQVFWGFCFVLFCFSSLRTWGEIYTTVQMSPWLNRWSRESELPAMGHASTHEPPNNLLNCSSFMVLFRNLLGTDAVLCFYSMTIIFSRLLQFWLSWICITCLKLRWWPFSPYIPSKSLSICRGHIQMTDCKGRWHIWVLGTWSVQSIHTSCSPQLVDSTVT